MLDSIEALRLTVVPQTRQSWPHRQLGIKHVPAHVTEARVLNLGGITSKPHPGQDGGEVLSRRLQLLLPLVHFPDFLAKLAPGGAQ